MKIFYGSCPQCSHIYSVADRLPNHCPECGRSLWANAEEMNSGKQQFREINFTVPKEKKILRIKTKG